MNLLKCDLIFHGPPIANKRPRFTRFGKPYDLQSNIKKNIRETLKSQFKKDLIEGAVLINWGFYMPIPKYLKKKIKAGDPHIKKPDNDNLIAIFQNCMSGIIFKDDALIFSGSFFKVYDHNPRTEIQIKWGNFNKDKGLDLGQPLEKLEKKILLGDWILSGNANAIAEQ